MFAIYRINERFLLAGKSYYDNHKKTNSMVFYRLIDTDTGSGFKTDNGKIQNIKNIGKSILFDYLQDKEFVEKEGNHFHNDIINESNIYVTSKEIVSWLKNENFLEILKK